MRFLVEYFQNGQWTWLPGAFPIEHYPREALLRHLFHGPPPNAIFSNYPTMTLSLRTPNDASEESMRTIHAIGGSVACISEAVLAAFDFGLPIHIVMYIPLEDASEYLRTKKIQNWSFSLHGTTPNENYDIIDLDEAESRLEASPPDVSSAQVICAVPLETSYEAEIGAWLRDLRRVLQQPRSAGSALRLLVAHDP